MRRVRVVSIYVPHPVITISFNYGPLSNKLGTSCKLYPNILDRCTQIPQRNDAYDAYGTYPIAQRPQNNPKDAFSAGVQRTQ